MEHESVIYEENKESIAVPKELPHKQRAIKDIDVSILHQALKAGDVEGAKGFMNSYNMSNHYFIRGPAEEEIMFKMAHGKQFSDVSIKKDRLNVLQLFILSGNYELVKFLMEDYKYIGLQRNQYNVNPRILLMDSLSSEDETFSIRLAIYTHSDIF